MAARPVTSINSSTAISAPVINSTSQEELPSAEKFRQPRLSVLLAIWYVVWSMLLLQIVTNWLA